MAAAAPTNVIELPERGARLTALAERAYREIKKLVLDNRVHGGEYLREGDLESHAAHALAARPDRAPYVKALRVHVTDMRRALARGDLDTWAQANDRFHMGLVASAGHQRLARICAH